jgi:SAM-dependent methyltransferase
MSFELSDELLELPFDQYQRYQVAADLVALLEIPSVRPVVDVGGGPGFVEGFLPDRDAVVVDVEGKHPGRFVIATGARLPFADRAFGVGLALDTLEHVPADDRPAFLSELRRVSDVVILSAPFAHPSVMLAEAALHEFVLQRFGGPFPTLEEHADHGLPDLDETVSAMAVAGWATATLASGYLPRWLGGMLLHHEFLAMGIPALPSLHAFYNATISRSDCRAPAYRQVVIGAREMPVERLGEAVASLRTDGDNAQGEAAVRAIAGAVLAHRLGAPLRSGEVEALRIDIERLQAELTNLERQVADRDAHIAELRDLNVTLQAELQTTRSALLEEARRSFWGSVQHRMGDWRARRRK